MKKPLKHAVTKQLFRGIFIVSFLTVALLIALGIVLLWAFAKTAPSPGTNTTIVHQLTEEEVGELNAALKSKGNPYPCINNTADTCINGPGISYYPVGYDNLDTLGHYQTTSAQTIKQIMGTIVEATNAKITLKTDSGRTFQVIFPADTQALDQFYANKGSQYNISTIVGQKLMVVYQEQPQNHSTTINKYQLSGCLLINPANL